MISQKRYKLGLAVVAAAMAYFLLTITVLMPHYSTTGNPSLISNTSSYPLRYGWLGNSFGEIVRKILFHPLEIVNVMLSGDRLKYLFALIAPVFSLAIFSWPVIIVFPVVAINLLSSLSLTYSVFFYHSAIIMPFIYFSAIITFKRLFLGNRNMEIFFSFGIVFVSLFFFHAYSLAPLAASNSTLGEFVPSENANKIEAIKNTIPANASISVQHNLGPHFSERQELYRYPLNIDKSDFVVLDRFDPYAGSKVFDFQYALQTDKAEYQSKIEELKASPDFKVFFDDGEYLIFERAKER
jgi:cell division protein FtsB